MAAASRQVRVPVLGSTGPRTIVIDDAGDVAAADIFLCLPGILETGKAFAGLAPLLGKNKRVVAVNFAGRGESDYLPSHSDYRMGLCVADIVATIAWLRGTLQEPAGKLAMLDPRQPRHVPTQIHVLGNSMGGLLGAYVAGRIPGYVHSLILNDVGCLLPWSGLMQLFGAIGRASITSREGLAPQSLTELARSLDVDPRLVSAVMNPSHLDLPHASGMQGICFEDSFSAVAVPILLMHSAASALVTPAVVERMQGVCRSLRVAAMPGDRHPLPFDVGSVARMMDFVANLRRARHGTSSDESAPLAISG